MYPTGQQKYAISHIKNGCLPLIFKKALLLFVIYMYMHIYIYTYIYLKGTVIETVDRKGFPCIGSLIPGPGWSQEPRATAGSPTWMAVFKVLGPSVASQGTLAGIWIRYTAAGIWTSALVIITGGSLMRYITRSAHWYFMLISCKTYCEELMRVHHGGLVAKSSP